MENPTEKQMIQDEEQLRLLCIFHYVVGGLTILFTAFFLLNFFVGLGMALNPNGFLDNSGNAPPAFLGLFFLVTSSIFIAFGWTLGALTIYSGSCIHRRRQWMFTLIMGGINCAIFPFGTALGVFTILVLSRDSVKRLFQKRPADVKPA
jgi:hypothetical protein